MRRVISRSNQLTTALIVALFIALPVAAAERGKFFGAKDTEHPSWFKESFLDFEEDIGEAAANGKRVMLYFWQPGCPYCNRLIEHNFAQKDIVDTTRKHFDVIAINMWGDREVITVGGKEYTEKTLAEALRVLYTPTLIFFSEDRKVALRLNGYYPPQNFRIALGYVAGKKEKELSYHDYFASQHPIPASGRLNTEPFFRGPPYTLVRKADSATRPLAVFFEQSQCRNCDTLHQKILKDPPTRKLAEQFESVQLDMWSDTPVVTPANEPTTAREWAKALNVNYAPSVVFFDASGKEVMRTDAFLKTFHFQSVLDYVLTEAYRTEPSFQRFISARADRLREQGIDVDIWNY